MHKALAAAIVVGCVVVGNARDTAPRAVHLTLREGTNMAAALSPDGRTIAIDLLGTLWTLPAQGGAATPITDIFLDARQPQWSPDGTRVASSEGALAAPAFGPNAAVAFNAIAGSHSRLMINDRNLADPDEDVFPFRPQWLPTGDLVYTADGKIKRRPAAGGAARTIEFSADVSFTRPAFVPKRHRFDLTGPQPVRGITYPALSPDGRQVAFA